MECWLLLCRWLPEEVVHHIRLHCVPALQCAVDVRFTLDKWGVPTPVAALDAIGSLVLRSSDKAVQEQGGSIGSYFIRCTQKATDCAFKCPQCDLNLSEYMLLRKLMVGLSDAVLKCQAYHACDLTGSVDELRVLDCAYKAVCCDAAGRNMWQDAVHTAGTAEVMKGEEAIPDVAASLAGKAQPLQSFRDCGTSHAPNKASCPARAAL